MKKQKKVDVIEGYRIVDMGLLQTLITSLACPDCLSTKLHLEEKDKKKKDCPRSWLYHVMNVILVHPPTPPKELSMKSQGG